MCFILKLSLKCTIGSSNKRCDKFKMCFPTTGLHFLILPPAKSLLFYFFFIFFGEERFAELVLAENINKFYSYFLAHSFSCVLPTCCIFWRIFKYHLNQNAFASSGSSTTPIRSVGCSWHSSKLFQEKTKSTAWNDAVSKVIISSVQKAANKIAKD